MELIVGILIGCALGFLISFLPGFNIGLALLSAPFIPLEPRITVGLIIGIDLVTNLVSYLHYLHPQLREDIDEDIKQEVDKSSLCINATIQYIFIRLIFSLAICLMLATQGTDIFKIDNKLTLMLTFGGALFLWFGLLRNSKYPIVACISLLGFISFTWITKELPINQPILIIFSSLYSINLINQLIYNPPKITDLDSKDYKVSNESWDTLVEGVICGLLSSFLWGLPTNSLCKVFEDKDKPSTKVYRQSTANAIMSTVGLSLYMILGAGRTAATSTANSIGEQFHYTEVIFILILLVVISMVIGYYWETVMKIYAGVYNKMRWATKLSTVVTIVTLIYLSNGLIILTSAICFCLNSIRKLAVAPSELSSSSLAAISLLSNF